MLGSHSSLLTQNKYTASKHGKYKVNRSHSPSKFEEDQPAALSRPGTPIRALKGKENSLRPGSRPGTPAISPATGSRGKHPLHPIHPINTPQQFHDWFAVIEKSIQHSQEAHFRSHLAQLSQYHDKFSLLSDELDQVDNEIVRMLTSWQGVEDGGRSLQQASEKLLEEKNRLINVTNAITARLAYFQELERATRMLNHPGEDLVLQPDFLIMVERVDICLEYLQNHRNYREADIYILRFQQCLIRAMSLVKIFFTNSLRNLSAEVERQLGEKSTSTLSVTHHLYSKFNGLANQVAPLLAEMEARATAYPSEVDSLLEECQTTFFTTRKYLLTPHIINEIKGLDPVHSELVELTRSGCGYLRNLCEDEFALYRRFFNSGEDRLYRYLESLCDFLYDDLRPRILHEQRMVVLCEVCTILQALMVLGSNVGGPEQDLEEQSGDQESIVPETPKGEGENKGLHTLQTSQLLQMILQDAQTRLVFKAQAIIQSDIRLHVPTDDDLRYPEKIIEYRNIVSASPTSDTRDNGDDNQSLHLPSPEVQKTWYPSVRKAIWIISLLQDLVKPTIFRDLVQEATSFCCESLEAASQRIAAKQEHFASIDSKLFLVRHLLVLKDLIGDLHLTNEEAEKVDVVSASEGIFGLSLLKPASLLGNLAYLGVPRLLTGAETPLNLDQELKRVCERLISDCVTAATLPVKMFLERSSAFSAAQNPEKNDQSAQEFATTLQAIEVNRDFKQVCEQEVKSWVTRARLYLEDERTVIALYSPLQNQIVEEYALFRGFLAGRYGPELLQDTYSEHELLGLLRKWLAKE
ncbi:Sec34-domain-containing protein [Serendipita vermifera]|nr:Sec34-domain-containing protein [Serendipita vermifera]